MVSGWLSAGLIAAGYLGVRYWESGQDSQALTPPSTEATCLPAVDAVGSDDRCVPWREIARPSVILNFWATWCDSCLEEVPHLTKLADSLGSGEMQGVRLVGIAQYDEVAAVRRSMDALEMRYLVFADENGAISETLGVQAIPQTWVVDREGRIVRRFHGAIEDQDVQWILDTLGSRDGQSQ